MGRGRAKRRPPAPSSSSSSDDELVLPETEEDDVDESAELMLLPVGAEVEVRSDDPGFAGSFYEATVDGHLPSGGYTVAYATLLADDGDDEPLRETAAAANVRPRPPPHEAGRGFAVHEMVEAFHNDGWWAGVVSAVLPSPVMAGDRRASYRVAFPTSRETLEFVETDLRPQRVFEDGRWVPAAEVDDGTPLFGEGNQVEVSGKSVGASWSPATVLKVIGVTHFLVQYMHTENDGELATEIVDSQDIRPARTVTRMGSKYRFYPSSHVEVHHEGSWWPGVIVEVLDSGLNKKYIVKLKNQEADMEDVEPVDVLTVENAQLRTRFDWDGKKWVRFVKELSHQNHDHEMHPFQESSNEPRLTSRKRLVPALYDDSDEISNETDSRRDKKLKNEDLVSGQTSPLPLSICNAGNEITHYQGNAVLALRSELSLPSLPPMTAFNQLSSSSLAPSCHLEQSSSQSIIIPSTPQSRQLRALLFGAFGQQRPDPLYRLLGTRSLNSCFQSIEGPKGALSDQDEQSTVGTRTELSKQIEECVSCQTAINPETTMRGITAKAIQEDNKVISVSTDLAELPKDMTAVCEILPKINMASCMDSTPQNGIRGSEDRSGIEYLKQGGYTGETSVEQDMTGGELYQRYLVTADNASVPLLPSVESCEANVHDNQLWKDNTAAAVDCVTCYAATLDDVVPNLLPLDGDLEVNITEDMDEENHQGNVVGLARNGHDNQCASADCQFSATSLTALENDMITNESPSRKLGSSQSVEKSMVTRLSPFGMSNYSVTEPFDHSLAMTNGVEGTPVSRYVAARTSDSVFPLSLESVAVHESTISMNGRLSGSLAVQHLPFKKTSRMWAHLEALEIFRKAPQRPHFRQFEEYCPELREGMALGLMYSFASLSESINMLDVQGDKKLLEQKMKSLALLEENGFNVRDLRLRIEILLATSNSCVEKLEEKIANIETYDQELRTQVCALAMTVDRLNLHAYLMRNMMRSAISQKMSNAMKISRLKAEANDLERSYLSNAVPR
ncbi:hypothetical protein ZWY2020_046054 [Hordeum vulgare]|nr:hypothetical protein ZWY2020_046054 [Hordeum vulgare]